MHLHGRTWNSADHAAKFLFECSLLCILLVYETDHGEFSE